MGTRLVEDGKPSDGLRVQLHPLALLTISDLLTRHKIRDDLHSQFVGGLLGQQNGREISIEHAFEARLDREGLDTYRLDMPWLQERVEQYKLVHKAGSLDLVGWFSNEPLTELRPAHVDIHHQILSLTDTALLLTVDPDLFGSASSQTGDDELPVSVYEGVRGAGGAAAAAAGPTAESSATSATTNANDDSGERMDVDIPAPDSDLRFKKLPYSIESGEAEMIAVSHVAKGGATRAAPAAAASASAASAADAAPKTPKGKERARDERGGHAGEQADAAATAATQRASKDPAAVDDGDDYDAEDFNEEYLTDEEREVIASMTAKANAAEMFQSRLGLISTYLAHLPPCYLNGFNASPLPDATDVRSEVDYPLLRSIQAFVNRLGSLEPPDRAALEAEKLREENDALVVALLAKLGEQTKNLQELNDKFTAIELHRIQRDMPLATPGGMFHHYEQPALSSPFSTSYSWSREFDNMLH